MHLQVRLFPAASPPDVEKVLGLLEAAGVNLLGAGGSNVEFGGELALVPEDGQEDLVMSTLSDYNPRLLSAEDADSGLTLCLAQHQSGGLHACLADASARNLETGRIIRDVVIVVPDDAQHAAHQVPVQIYSEEVRTPQSMHQSGPGDNTTS